MKLLSNERIGLEPVKQLPVNFSSPDVYTENNEDAFW
jgi:hypothetical protein